MTVLQVPYHVDEFLPELDFPLRAADTIRADLPAGDAWARLAAIYRLVADAVAGAAERGVRPAVLSGDCSTALGTMAGLQRAGIDAGIVWLDAHGDVQTLETTASGYLPGMSLRFLVGYRPELIAVQLGLRPVPEHRVVLVDARDLDPPEAAPTSPARESAAPKSLTSARPSCRRGRCTFTSMPTWLTRPTCPACGTRRPAAPGARRSQRRLACSWQPAGSPRSASPARGIQATMPRWPLLQA